MLTTVGLLLSFLFIGVSHCFVSYQPEQIHLSYGDNPWEMVVTWSTTNDTKSSIVEYGINGLILKASGKRKLFVNGGPEKRGQYIHRVKLKDLTPESKYMYHCGSHQGWSDMFSFVTPPSDKPWSPHLAIYGDMGNQNAKSLSRLQAETQRGMYDAIIHVGDFAYDMDMENGRIGDEFMKQIQPIAAYLPYMTCPGNHEEKYNFSDYRNRFNMPGKRGELMYSFNMGPVHFISISTEVYYFMQYGIKELITQYYWLEQDLKEATHPTNRSVRPWIILFGHRPMYCSNERHIDCSTHEDRVRIGIPFLRFFGLEKLLYDSGVDLFIWAHEHSYERTWPLYDYKVYNGSTEDPYRNYGAPVHITTGSAGCKEGQSPFEDNRPDWSAFRSNDYGYTRLRAYNNSHLYLEQVSDDKGGAVIDQVWIIKESHGPYAKLDED